MSSRALIGKGLVFTLCTAGITTAAVVTVDVSNVKGPTKRFERHNTWMSATNTATERQLLKDLPTESIRASWGRTSSTVAYESQTRDIGATPVYNVWGYTSDFAKYEEELYNNLLALKAKWPDMVWVEICNEPDGTGWYDYQSSTRDVTNNNYVNLLLAGGRAVTRANTKLAAGVPQMKVGGPVTYKWNPYYIEETIKRVAEKKGRLDAVIWHDYHRPQSPGDYVDHCNQVRGWIKKYGFPDSTRIVITEWGLFPGTGSEGKDPSSALLLKSATFVAAGNHFWMEGGADIVHQWVVRHQTGYAKSQLAPVADKVYPFYNVLKAMSMNKALRVNTTFSGTNAMTPQGIGVGGYGTYDSSGAAAFVWNYEGSQDNATVSFTNLPANFAAGPISYQVFLIDETHSNYKYDAAKDKLQKVAEGSAPAGSGFSHSLTLKKNSVAMVVLKPAQQGTTRAAGRDRAKPSRPNGLVVSRGMVSLVGDGGAQEFTLQVTNLQGRQILRRAMIAGSSLSLEGLTPGIYRFRLSGNGVTENHVRHIE